MPVVRPKVSSIGCRLRSLVRLAGPIALLAGSLPGQGSTVSLALGPPTSARRVLQAARSGGGNAITIDGRLGEPAWGAAAHAGDFLQHRPEPERAASQRTDVRVLIDDDALYVAFRLHDSAPDSIAGPLLRRDGEGYSDWAHVLVDSYHDRRTAFRFAVNPSGVKRDALVSNDEEWSEDTGWDAVWETATGRDSSGWTAEVRIPLSQLRFRACRERCQWGIQFARDVARRNERSLWAPIPAGAAGFVSRFGDLEGIDGLRTTRTMEVAPYTVAQHRREPVIDGSPSRGAASTLSGGADVKLGVTPNITLTGTVNPDFGQVEADPSEVNLTAFETFLAERRPFFVEGSEIFAVRVTSAGWVFGEDKLFYSRRIGRAPQRSLPDDIESGDLPQTTTILGAAKLAGKTARGWSLGLLSALTGSESAGGLHENGARERFRLEPMTHYGVARVSRDFRGGRGALGTVLSTTNRRLDDDSLRFLHSSAVVGGIDWRWRSSSGIYWFGGNVLGSTVRGTPEAITRTQRSSVHLFQRPDARRLEVDSSLTSLSGVSAELRATRNGGGHWRWGIVGRAVSSGFEMNDVGFQLRSDVLNTAGWLGFDQYRPSPRLQRWSMWTNHWAQWSIAGERQVIGSNIFADAQLANYWSVVGRLERQQSALSTTLLRGGPAVVQPGSNRWFVRIESDQRRRITIGAGTSGTVEDEGGARSIGLFKVLNARPSDRSELSVQPAWNTTSTPWQYVGTETDADGRDRYVVASMRQSTWSLTTRASYVFTPNLSFQLYAQPFVSAGRYRGLREVAEPRARRFDDRFPLIAGVTRHPGTDKPTYRIDRNGDGRIDYAIDDPDFTVREVRANAVLRWEYRPGSMLFVVWSQQRSRTDQTAELDAWRSPGEVFGVPGPSALLIKLSYWLKR